MRLLHRDRHRHEDPSPTPETEPIDLTAGDRRADPDAPINDEITVERREADDSGRHFWSRR